METSKNNKVASGFLKQGSILAVASILVRLIGMIYRIPMANIIGDEGNGVYSAAFEIYNILLIISSYGCLWLFQKWFRQKSLRSVIKVHIKYSDVL